MRSNQHGRDEEEAEPTGGVAGAGEAAALSLRRCRPAFLPDSGSVSCTGSPTPSTRSSSARWPCEADVAGTFHAAAKTGRRDSVIRRQRPSPRHER